MLTAKATMFRWRVFGMIYIGSLMFLLFQGGKTSLMLFCILNVLLLYLVLGRWSGIGSVTGERRLSNAAGGVSQSGRTFAAGARMDVQLSIRVPGIWPIPYILVRDRLIRQNGSSVPFEASFVPSYRRAGEVSYTTPPLERGVYQFAPTECSTRDIFGLFEHAGSFESSVPFSVYPRMVSIRQWRQLKQGVKGPYSTSSSRLSAKETTQINGVREYIYGDRLSRIHWNATARTGQWKSKEFERESLPRTVFILDRYAASYDNQEQFETGVSVIASLLDFGFRRATAVGLVSAGESMDSFAPQSSSDHRQMLMNHLVKVQPDGATPLYRMLRQASSLIPAGSFVVVVSPQGGEEAVRSMEWLSRKSAVPVLIHLTSPINAGNIADTMAKGADWLRLLQRSGYAAHSLGALHELPGVLEGGSA
ncbi:DUF58 domain-containing protein [Paenibacillus nasutitermitis]|uniref:DUF58 domain-containing protein n=1 Tax=Paenibacillus nasutitermitis TaxID=1652958 RepID=A0A916Z1Z8_9BACL|nr:DUF58 domain-containing protein [Paenibacillus nasutitermitis]GGD71898.1 hypothetical protein GCM10010911_32280 [Paenibacillus nasutitermitis]